MERKEFLRMGCCAVALLAAKPEALAEKAPAPDDLTFIQNWVTDLMDTVDAELDEPTKIKLMNGCGRGCFRRFKFKRDIAAEGKGSVDKLIQALKHNFEAWREGDTVHVRFGAVNRNGCYCPAARFRAPKPNDTQCFCSRATHQAIWETALGRPMKVDILQSVRRGDPTCHFLVHLT